MKDLTWQQAKQLLNEAYRESVALRPIFAQIMGDSLAVGMYLSRAYYWRDKGKDPDGWIYKTCEEFQTETFLSRRQQDKARQVLKTKPWWEEKVARVGATPKFHYRINSDLLDEEVINFVLGKSLTKLDLIASDKLDLIASDKSDLITAIAYTKTDSSKITSKSSLERTRKKKLGEAKSLISKTPEPVAQALEQAQISSVLPVDPTLVDGEKGSAARSISTDKTKTIFGKTRPSVAQKQRAEEANWLSSGVTNKRWKDRQDLDKFVAYVEIYTENRRQDPELNPDGTKYGKEYQTAILNRTATTQDENDSMLVCWKTWNLEPVAPNYIESKPEEVVVVDVVAEAAFQTNRANLKAVNAARKAAAAADKLKKIEIVRGLYES